MSIAKQSTLVGVFDERTQADRAIDALGDAGFRPDQIGVMTQDVDGKTTINEEDDNETHAGTGAVTGAVTGAGIGGLVGLGVLAGVVPVIGPAIAAGTLATILTNAAVGAGVAGLAGGLIGWGIPEEDAKYYEGEIKGGRIVVTVHPEDRYDEAQTILESHGAYNRHTRAAMPVHI